MGLKGHLLVAALPVRVGEVEEGARVVRLEPHRFGVRGHRLLEAAETPQRDAAVVVRLGPVGLQPDDLIERAQGVGEERLPLLVVLRPLLRLVAVGRAEVEERARLARVRGDERLQHLDRESVLARVVVDISEVHGHVRVVRLERERLLIGVGRLGPLLGARERVAELLQDLRVPSLEPRGVAVGRRRLLEAVERVVGVAQILERLLVHLRDARDVREGLGGLRVLALRVERLAQLELRLRVAGVDGGGALQ